MKIPIIQWKPRDGIVMESAALAAVNDFDNSLIIAGPGAGKTELLAQKACFLLETNSCGYPRKILALSFKKDAAVNLKERVGLRLSKNISSRFISLTYDSFAKGILDRFLYALPEEYRPKSDYLIAQNQNEIKHAFYKCGVELHKYNEKNHIKKLTQKKINSVSGIYKDVWNKLLKGEDGIESTLTFQMISILAIHILETNPLILKSLRETYTYAFLDEFQDTTEVQYALVKACFQDTQTSITAVGDRRQRIMLWAGAKSNVFESYILDFKATEYMLTMNHRSAPRLLEIQKIVNLYLQDTPFEPIPSPKWTKDEGVAELWYSENSSIESKQVAEKISQFVHHQQIPHRDICIILKQNVQKFSVELIDELKKENIEARNESEFQDLLKEDIVQLILHTIRSALDVRNSDSWVHILEARMFFEGQSGSLSSVVVDKVRKEFKLILNNLKNKLVRISEEEELNEVLIEIIECYDIYKLKTYYPQYSQGEYMEILLVQTSSHLFRYYSECKDWLDAIASFEGENSIPIMTIHKSKGLEFNAVFFIGFDDYSFWKFSEQKEEDTCTFFVGLSRAKKYLYFTFSETRFGRKQTNDKISDLYKMLNESGVIKERMF